jgi:hypothetical protein
MFVRVCLLASVSACSDLTKVSEPDVIQPSALNNAQGAQAYRASSIGRFAVAYSFAAIYSGLIGDEFTATAGGSREDQRQLSDPGQDGYPYSLLQQARVNSLYARQGLEQYSPTPGWQIAEMFSLSGYAELLFAEHLCQGVHLATLVDGEPTQGPSLSRTQLLAQARLDFDSALAHASGSDSLRYLAELGTARALLDLDSVVEAAAGTADVPTKYVYPLQYSSANSLVNQMAQLLSDASYTVSNREGINGLDFGTANDPRVPISAQGTAGDGITPLYLPINDTSQSGPIPLANGTEARLIESEGALAGGQPTLWLAKLNELRADSAETGVAGLAPVVDPGTDTGRVSLTFRERAYWLFATAHRQGDLRRLVRHYGRDQSAVFPTGPYKEGGSYGSDVTFPFSGESSSGTPECVGRAP